MITTGIEQQGAWFLEVRSTTSTCFLYFMVYFFGKNFILVNSQCHWITTKFFCRCLIHLLMKSLYDSKFHVCLHSPHYTQLEYEEHEKYSLPLWKYGRFSHESVHSFCQWITVKRRMGLHFQWCLIFTEHFKQEDGMRNSPAITGVTKSPIKPWCGTQQIITYAVVVKRIESKWEQR